MPDRRMPLDEEYRVDPTDGDCYTKGAFVTKYGTELGSEKWEAAKLGLERLNPQEVELNPREGDVILTKNRLEGIVLKRLAMRIRIETMVEGESKQTWKELQDVSKILAKYEKKCFNFRIDILAPDWGRCKCGRTKGQHNATAIRRKSGLYRELTVDSSPTVKMVSVPVTETTLVTSNSAAAAAASAAAAADDDESEDDEGGDVFSVTALAADPCEEFRIDPQDGFAYSLQDFMTEYGGKEEWDAAEPAVNTSRKMTRTNLPLPDFTGLSFEDEEFKIDPNDGNAYQKASFISEYGGTDEWDAAMPPTKSTRRMSKVVW